MINLKTAPECRANAYLRVFLTRAVLQQEAPGPCGTAGSARDRIEFCPLDSRFPVYPHTALNGGGNGAVANPEGYGCPVPGQEVSARVKSFIMPVLVVFGACAAYAAFQSARAEAAAPAPINVIRAEPGADRDGQLQGAYRAYRAGDLDAARSGYAEVLQDYPDNRDAMLGLAACAVREGDLRSAASMYRRVTRAYPQDAWARAALAGLQGSRQGEPVIRELLAQQPDDPFLHHALGQLQAAQARWPEARRAFAAARRVDPANPVYALNLAISLDRMGQREEALNYYRATLKLVEQSASGLDIRPVVRRINALRRP